MTLISCRHCKEKSKDSVKYLSTLEKLTGRCSRIEHVFNACAADDVFLFGRRPVLKAFHIHVFEKPIAHLKTSTSYCHKQHISIRPVLWELAFANSRKKRFNPVLAPWDGA